MNPDPIEGPYVGLDAFDGEHAHYFFGRTLESEILCDNVLARPWVVYFGASGVGKSSLLNVGLAQALQRRGVPATIEHRRQWHEPAEFGRWLSQCVARGQAQPDRPLILVLDQFEEMFLYTQEKEALQWARSLAALERLPELEVRIVFALRDDSLHRMDSLRRELPRALDSTLELKHLGPVGVQEAIEQPLRVWNERHTVDVRADTHFAATLMAQLQKEAPQRQAHDDPTRIELAYLQLTLQKIWDAEMKDGSPVLRTDTLTRQLDGVGGIARQHVQAVLGGRPQADQALIADVIDRLVTPSGGKILYSASDLAHRFDVSVERMEAVLQPLTTKDSRLLRAVELPGLPRRRGYEIVHDVLAQPLMRWSLDRSAVRERQRADEEALAREQAEADRAAARTSGRWATGFAVVAFVSLGAAVTYAIEAVKQEAKAQASAALAKGEEQVAKENATLAKSLADREQKANASLVEANARLSVERARITALLTQTQTLAEAARLKQQEAERSAQAAIAQKERADVLAVELTRKVEDERTANERARAEADRARRAELDLKTLFVTLVRTPDLNLGALPVPLSSRRDDGLEGQLSFGKFAADAFRVAAGADFAYFSTSSLRGAKSYPANQTISMIDVMREFPFSNRILKGTIAGTKVREILESGFARPPFGNIQFSGAQVVVDMRQPVGKRLVNVQIAGRPLVDAERYAVATTSFHAMGGDGFPKFDPAELTDVGLDMLLLFPAVGKPLQQSFDQPRVTFRAGN